VISYINDCLVFYKNKSVLEELILSLKDKFKLTNEGDLATFLGININKTKHNTLELTQPHLIERIIKAVGLNGDIKMHGTLANTTLFYNKSSPKCIQTWNY